MNTVLDNKTIEIRKTIGAVIDLQTLASKRGLELIYAIGTKWKLYEKPESIWFTGENVEMTFEEDTRHDCPDRESITLSYDELTMNDDEWQKYIDDTIAKREKKRQESAERKQEEDRQSKLRQFDQLKQELGL